MSERRAGRGRGGQGRAAAAGAGPGVMGGRCSAAAGGSGGPCPRGPSPGRPLGGVGSGPCPGPTPPGTRVPAGARRQVTAGQLRERGNALFQAGDHAAALAAYTQALSLCDGEPERAVLHRNRAACYLKLVRTGRVTHRGVPAGTCPAAPACWGCAAGGCPGPSAFAGCAGRPCRSPGRVQSVPCFLRVPFLLSLPTASPLGWTVGARAGHCHPCLGCVYALGLFPRQSQRL